MSGVCDHVFNIKSGSLYKAIFMSTGKLIKELRLKKGMTQEELAEKTDLSIRTIQRIEKGEVDPRAYTHQIIAEVLEVDFELLYSNNEPDIVNESVSLRKEHPGRYENRLNPVPKPEEWFHVNIIIDHPVVKVFVNNSLVPSLTVNQLSKRKSGMIGLCVGNNSDGYFRNLKVIKE